MFKKLLMVLLLLVVLCIAAMVAFPNVFKDRITRIAKAKLNEQLTATVNFADVQPSLFRSFPYLHLNFDSLTVVGTKTFANDTLLYAEHLSTAVNLSTLFGAKEVEIKKLHFTRPRMHLKVSEQGQANWSITAPKESAKEPSQNSKKNYKIALKKYIIEDALLRYEDLQSQLMANLRGINHEGKGSFSKDTFLLNTTTNVIAFTADYKGVKYLNETRANATANLLVNTNTDTYTFKENNIQLNDLNIGFNGDVQLPPTTNDMLVNIDFAAKQTDFKSLLSLLPAAYTNDFNDVEASGTAAFNGYVKGTYNNEQIPNFKVNAQVTNGQFQYPNYAKSVDNIQASIQVQNNNGLANDTEINVQTFTFTLGNEPFALTAYIKHPQTNADFNITAKGTLNLHDVSQAYPLPQMQSLSGLISTDLVARGNLEAIDKKQYQQVDIRGNMLISQLAYTQADLPAPIKIDAANLNFSPQAIDLLNASGELGESDFSATGSVSNFLPYYFSNGTLNGKISLNAEQLNLNEWIPTANTADTIQLAQKATTETTLVVPERINLQISGNANTLRYDDLVLNNLNGDVQIKNEQIQVNKVQANAMDGLFAFNGSYNTANKEIPLVAFNYNMTNVNINQLLNAFDVAPALAPVAEYMSGKISTTINIQGELNNQLQPQLTSFNGDGLFAILEANLNDFEPLLAIADRLQIKSLENLQLSDISTQFTVADGRVIVAPFQFNINDIDFSVAGSHGFDNTLDYNILARLPRALFGSQANALVNNLVTQAQQQGVSISIPQYMNVQLDLGGTLQKPKVSANFNQAFTDTKTLINNQAQQLLQQGKDLLQSTTDSISQQANQLYNKAKDEANQQLNQIKEGAQNAAQQGTDSLKNYIQNKAKDLINNGQQGLNGLPDSTRKNILQQGENIKNTTEDAIKDFFNKPKSDEPTKATPAPTDKHQPTTSWPWNTPNNKDED